MRLKKNSNEVLILRAEKINCLNCGLETNKYRFGNYKEARKFCSHNCSVIFNKNINCGKNHYRWKGLDADYSGKHTWIYRHYGKANKCENASCKGLNNTFQWSNISGEYKRDISDYKQLCRSCHGKYDHIRLYGNYCRRGHPRDKEENRKYSNGKWKECPQCRRENEFNRKKKLCN